MSLAFGGGLDTKSLCSAFLQIFYAIRERLWLMQGQSRSPLDLLPHK